MQLILRSVLNLSLCSVSRKKELSASDADRAFYLGLRIYSADTVNLDRSEREFLLSLVAPIWSPLVRGRVKQLFGFFDGKETQPDEHDKRGCKNG